MDMAAGAPIGVSVRTGFGGGEAVVKLTGGRAGRVATILQQLAYHLQRGRRLLVQDMTGVKGPHDYARPVASYELLPDGFEPQEPMTQAQVIAWLHDHPHSVVRFNKRRADGLWEIDACEDDRGVLDSPAATQQSKPVDAKTPSRDQPAPTTVDASATIARARVVFTTDQEAELKRLLFEEFEKGRQAERDRLNASAQNLTRMAAAERTVVRLGYTWEGGSEWKPPLRSVSIATFERQQAAMEEMLGRGYEWRDGRWQSPAATSAACSMFVAEREAAGGLAELAGSQPELVRDQESPIAQMERAKARRERASSPFRGEQWTPSELLELHRQRQERHLFTSAILGLGEAELGKRHDPVRDSSGKAEPHYAGRVQANSEAAAELGLSERELYRGHRYLDRYGRPWVFNPHVGKFGVFDRVEPHGMAQQGSSLKPAD